MSLQSIQYDNATGKLKTVDFSNVNSLINGSFNHWQRNTTFTTPNNTAAYTADCWYLSHSLGTNSVLTTTRATGSLDGSLYQFNTKVSTAATASQNSAGFSIRQVLENKDSLKFYNKKGSFGIWIKAQGNVNQVAVTLFYATTETKLASSTGVTSTFVVNTSTFTFCNISGSVGTSQTRSGVVGVDITVSGVSTGNVWDLNNGVILEQGMFNVGSTVAPFVIAGGNEAGEMDLVRRYYQKSYDTGVFAGTSSAFAGLQIMTIAPDNVDSDWTTYTGVNSSWGNSVVTYTSRYKKMKDSGAFAVGLRFSSTVPGGALNFTQSQLFGGLGLSVDTSKMVTQSDNRIAIGEWVGYDNGQAIYGGEVMFNVEGGSNDFYLTNNSNNTLSNTTPFTWNSGDSITLAIDNLPISGWTSVYAVAGGRKYGTIQLPTPMRVSGGSVTVYSLNGTQDQVSDNGGTDMGSSGSGQATFIGLNSFGVQNGAGAFSPSGVPVILFHYTIDASI